MMRPALVVLATLMVASPGFAQSPPTADTPAAPKPPAAPQAEASEAGDQAPAPRPGPAAPRAEQGEGAPEDMEPSPPRGPADIINRSREPQTPEPMQRPVPQRPGGSPHTGMFGPAQPAARAFPSTQLPPGTIHVQVHDPGGALKPDTEVRLGVMGSLGQRTSKTATTDAQGIARFTDLATGSKQSYRVNVSFGGAVFSSTPFRLPADKGYQARVHLKPTTTDPSRVVELMGMTMVEVRDDRLHISQQARLLNAGQSVYVLPEGGLQVRLPKGYTAFTAQEVMTDQQLEATDQGFALRGSLAPGSVTLGWTYDVDREGEQAVIPVDLPFRTLQYRVISDAPEGSKLKVEGFPEAQKISDRGRDLWVTQARTSEVTLPDFAIRVEGIPGPGPARWIALSLAIVALLAGAVAVFKPGTGGDRESVLQQQKTALLDEALETARLYEDGEIGPQYRARRLDEILTALASVLRDQEALESNAAKGAQMKGAKAKA